MPSHRKRDAGKNKLVHLSPATANGWIVGTIRIA
jgi:hypothetical protein